MKAPAENVAAVVALLAFLALPWAAWPVRAADEDKPAGNPPGGNPLELYHQGHYDDAYRAYEDLAKKDPKADGLQFNAGASAYMGRQYDEAMDAFGKALTSNDPALRARSHYNFGNTLFRRGGQQKDGKARIADWHNAIQHYDSTLDMLKRADPDRRDPALAANTAYNRDFVQKLLEEEQRKQQQQQKDQDKKDKKDQQGPQDKSQQGQPQDKSKQDQSQGGKQPSQDQNGSSSSQDQKGQGSQPPKTDEQGQGGQDANQPPPSNGGSGEQKDPSQGQGKTPSSQPPQNPSQGNGQPADGQNPGDPHADQGQAHGAPDPSNLPDQSQPRQRGDFQAQPGQGKDTPPPSKDGEAGQEAGEAPEQTGKMSKAQAEALLNALRGDDARVGIDPNNKHRRDEPVTKDW